MIYGSILPFSINDFFRALYGSITGQEQISLFEKRLEEFLGLPAIVVDSGLTSIKLFLRTIGLNSGDEIALPAYLCKWVGKGIMAGGYSLNFIDVDENYNLSPIDLIRKISPKTKAIIAPHTYGIPCKIDEIIKIAASYDIPVLDDSAQSFGGKYNGKLLGTYGHAGIFSFGWIKPLTTMGGGALVSGDTALLQKARSILLTKKDYKTHAVKLYKSFGYINKFLYFRIVEGIYKIKKNVVSQQFARVTTHNRLRQPGKGNIISKFQPVQASVGLTQLARIIEFNRKRMENSSYLINNMATLPITFPAIIPGAPPLRLPARFSNLNKEQTRMLSRLYLANGIEAPMLYPYLPEIFGIKAACPNARILASQTVALPVHPCLTRRDLNKIIQVTRKLVT